MAAFRLTEQAQADLDGIGAYTLEMWGYDQAALYLSQLDAGFVKLAQSSSLGRDRSDIRSGLRSFACKRHHIFFRLSADGAVEVLRILHERMDFQRHL